MDAVEYLTTHEAAAHLKVSASLLSKLRMASSPRKGPRFIKNGTVIRYRRDWLDEWAVSKATDETRRYPTAA